MMKFHTVQFTPKRWECLLCPF